MCQTRVCAETRAGFLPLNLPLLPRSAASTLPCEASRSAQSAFPGRPRMLWKARITSRGPAAPRPPEGEKGCDDVPVGHRRREITEGEHFPQRFPQHPPSASPHNISPQYLPPLGIPPQPGGRQLVLAEGRPVLEEGRKADAGGGGGRHCGAGQQPPSLRGPPHPAPATAPPRPRWGSAPRRPGGSFVKGGRSRLFYFLFFYLFS